LNKRQFDIKRFWVRLWKMLEPVHPKIKKLAVLMLVVELVKLAGPYLLKILIDALNTGIENTSKIILLIVGIFLAYQIQSILGYFLDNLLFRVLLDSDRELFIKSFRKLMYLHLGYHEKENTGNKVSKIDRGIGKIDDLISAIGWEVGPTLIQVMLTLPVLFFVSWMFGLVVVFFIPIFVLLTLRVNKINYPLRDKRHDLYEEVSGKMIQSVININTVKSFTQEEKECTNVTKALESGYKVHFKEFGNITRYNLGRNFVNDSGRAFILLAGLLLVYKGMLTIGGLVFVYTISEKALLSLFRISRLYDKIMDSSEAVERLYDLSLVKSKIKNPPKGIKPKQITGLIQFKNLSFSYDDNGKNALDEINLELSAGCTTALVGPSGGGKTTLARMIYRHYDPQKGSISIDEIDIKKYDLYAFRRHIAIVPQEVEIFNTSIRDNIAYAKSKASFEEVEAAAKIANCAEFIEQLSEGYDTMVGERGVKLSGGQRQRVGIARAILANPDILIFDEATSSLDSYSERLIQEAMEKVSRNRTVIIIAHRLSTIKKANKIVVLEKGKVVEQGSHLELASKKKGLYKKLLELQKMGEVE